ncbi:hypothetical protein XA68_13346 [Ophiocordyceps unilateralis]|uniref:Uncharacterized protein n=1 Tax=Ophiocordyceps unilateralis TaxID=268505 RepID=A0A2A9PCF7_OPHUN|nr:hypothetical protein XA68_13346 [Ophiocordyceps unilateralis]
MSLPTAFFSHRRCNLDENTHGSPCCPLSPIAHRISRHLTDRSAPHEASRWTPTVTPGGRHVGRITGFLCVPGSELMPENHDAMRYYQKKSCRLCD